MNCCFYWICCDPWPRSHIPREATLSLFPPPVKFPTFPSIGPTIWSKPICYWYHLLVTNHSVLLAYDKDVRLYSREWGSFEQSSLLSIGLLFVASKSIDQSPLETSSLSPSQEITCVLLNLKYITMLISNQSHVRVLSQITPVHTAPSSFCKIHLNCVLPITPWFPHQNPVCIPFLYHICHMPRPSPYFIS
jgi:hypothetical protein